MIHKKLSFSIRSSLIFVCVSVITIGSAVFYSMHRLNSTVPREYTESISRANAGIDAQAVLLRLHKSIAEFVLSEGKSGSDPAQMQSLEKRLRSDILAALGKDSAQGAEMIRLLDDWLESKMRMIALIRQGRRLEEMRPSFGTGSETYNRLETRLGLIAAENQRSMEKLAREAEDKYADTMRFVWWLWSVTVAFNVLAGVMIVRKARKMIERDRRTSKRLFESEERLKLALSGADEGTWDLDIPSGRLNFDSQWGKLLGYTEENARPHSFEEWARLIHPNDRKRVLRAMHNHVEGKAPEYSAEYRILSRSGNMIWVLGLGRAVSFDREGKAVRVVGVTRDITHKKESEERIWHLAHHDTLTGLPNRALFHDRLKHLIAIAKRRNQMLALLFLDLDGFKEVNDHHGHDAGDELLREVASRLVKNIRSGDFVSRMGGDEFVFILRDIRQREDAAAAARKIIDALAEPVKLDGLTCSISGSIGIAVFPDDGDELEPLVRLSDLAMYSAKQAGRNNFKFYAEEGFSGR